ncbi:hypothetical protein OS493_040118, partial [Desmophyllum pertusum]
DKGGDERKAVSVIATVEGLFKEVAAIMLAHEGHIQGMIAGLKRGCERKYGGAAMEQTKYEQ